MIYSHSRGHKTYFDGNDWRYVDNNEIVNDMRPCKRCGKRHQQQKGTMFAWDI